MNTVNDELEYMGKKSTNRNNKSKAKAAVMSPEYRMKVVGAKSGKGSYRRREKFVERYYA